MFHHTLSDDWSAYFLLAFRRRITGPQVVLRMSPGAYSWYEHFELLTLCDRGYMWDIPTTLRRISINAVADL